MTPQSMFNRSTDQIKSDFNEIVEKHHHHLDFDRECEHLRRIVVESAQDPAQVSLYEVDTNALCTILLEIAAIGLTLSPALQHVMLKGEFVNFKPSVKMYVTYKGMQQLAFDTGNLLAINSWVICKNDKVKITSTTEEPLVEIENLFAGRGEVVGAFCTLKLTDGSCLTTSMTIHELDTIAEMSGNEGWFGPFKNEFRRKQAIKRALSTFYSQYCDYIIDAEKYFSEYEDQINIDTPNDNDDRTPAEKAMNWNNGKTTAATTQAEDGSIPSIIGDATKDAIIEDAIIEDAIIEDAIVEDAIIEDAIIEDAVDQLANEIEALQSLKGNEVDDFEVIRSKSNEFNSEQSFYDFDE